MNLKEQNEIVERRLVRPLPIPPLPAVSSGADYQEALVAYETKLRMVRWQRAFLYRQIRSERAITHTRWALLDVTDFDGAPFFHEVREVGVSIPERTRSGPSRWQFYRPLKPYATWADIWYRVDRLIACYGVTLPYIINKYSITSDAKRVVFLSVA